MQGADALTSRESVDVQLVNLKHVGNLGREREERGERRGMGARQRERERRANEPTEESRTSDRARAEHSEREHDEAGEDERGTDANRERRPEE